MEGTQRNFIIGVDGVKGIELGLAISHGFAVLGRLHQILMMFASGIGVCKLSHGE
jgi:hypothetical protein